MKTPICDFVNEYKNSGRLRLHMPGHKGKDFIGIEGYDITEITGADVLYNANGIIRESEKNASKLFGTKKTLYSTEGSSLSVRAMLYLATLYAKENGKKPLIAAGRNAHRVFMTAAALLDFDIAWIYPQKSESIISCDISPDYLDAFLSGMDKKPVAVYITSPDYLGNTADIKGLSAVCKKHGALLLVDNAHGAYLRFLPEDIHPISLGADICCDSAHKTLPVLTGGAYLHISENAPEIIEEYAENAMLLFASTSPSYIIMQSLDMANKYISDGYPERLSETAESVENLKKILSDNGFDVIGNEPMKLTVCPANMGYTGEEFADILSSNGIECEFSDPDFTVMMFTPEIGNGDIEHIGKVILSIEKREAIIRKPPVLSIPERAMTVREAAFSASEEIDVADCEGRILSSAAISCPPAIPITVCGEIISKDAIKCFEYYGIEKCRVVKN